MKQKADVFIFDSFVLANDRKTLSLNYQVRGKGIFENFEEVLHFPDPIPNAIPDTLLKRLFFSLHLVSGINYYKAFIPSSIQINSGSLDQRQADFWNVLYTKGLGEFFYRNSLDFRGLIAFPYGEADMYQPVTINVPHLVLLGIGGGKDSLLSAELLKQVHIPFKGLVVEKKHRYPLLHSVEQSIGSSFLSVQRELSPRLFELNKSGTVYNGHIPISAIYAFIGVLMSALYGFRFFVTSNEKSANIGNIEYLGMEVNHQWSKSSEFEGMLQNYLKTYISPSVGYISLLRPLTEIHIVRLFTKYPQYFHIFSSCNRNFSILNQPPTGLWCGSCPKCAFIFILLAAFLSRDAVLGIMKKNLLEDESLISLYRGLLGWGAMKPFECVGTHDEVDAAFRLVLAAGSFNSSVVMKMYAEYAPPKKKEVCDNQYKELMKADFSKMPSEFLPVYQLISSYETDAA